MSVELTVPEVGESITEVQIGRWLKSDGEAVDKDEDLVEIETDKASVVISAPEAGVLSIVAEEGGFAEVGDVIARIEEGEGSDAAKKTDSGSEDDADEAGRQEAPDAGAADTEDTDAGGDDGDDDDGDGADGDSEDEGSGDGPTVMPAARRLLDEHDLSAGDVKATGPGGRLLKEDVQRHVAEGEARQAARAALRDDEGAGPEVATPPDGDARREEVRPMSMIRRTIASRLVEAQQEAALLTTFNEADMQPVKDLRARHRQEFEDKHGVKLGFMSFFVKASVAALQRFPAVNSIVRDKEIVTRHYYDIGIAVGGGKGLVVPVIRDADRLSFAEIERRIADLGARAQSNEIQPEELEGGTFTISNGGIYGSLLSTPIVNPPQSGILGMHAIQERPVVRDGEVVVRPMMYLALTYDHRIIDGREAVTFLRTIKEFLEEPARLVLDL